ncbi:hypothetical protein D3C72_1351130 [compost metagenome]
MKTSVETLFLEQSKTFLIFKLSFLLTKNSFFKFVSTPLSRIIFGGKSLNSQVIITSVSVLLIFKSSCVILTVLLLKKISKASKIVDFPISFFPIKVVKLSKLIKIFSS